MRQRIAELPIPKNKLPAFTHSHVHSTWVYGTEVQGLDLRTIQKIGTAVVDDAFDASSHRMQSPFLFLATAEDPYLDPFAKWVRHVLVHLLTVRLKRFYGTPSIARCLNPVHAMDSEMCCHTSWLEFDGHFFPP